MDTTKKNAPVNPPPKSPGYIQAALFVGTLGILGVLGLSYLRPGDDILVLSAISFSFTTGIYNVIKTEQTRVQSVETHDMVNSRLTEFIESQALLAEARGEKIGRKKAEDRADAVVKRDKK
jgi:hypothetical protein